MVNMKNEKENLRVAMLHMASTEVFFITVSDDEIIPVQLNKGQDVFVEMEYLEKAEGIQSYWKPLRPFVWVYPQARNSTFRILMNKKFLV
jgi:hypothetical protein